MRISDFDVLIVPCLGGADEGDWPSCWSAKLSTARVVAPSDVSAAEREAWTDAIANAASAARRPVLFVGQGLSARPPSPAPPSRSAPRAAGADVEGHGGSGPANVAGGTASGRRPERAALDSCA